MIRWGRTRANWWVALVLPGLLLRALIPIGFMPVFAAHFGVQLSICEGYAPLVSRAMQMPADMPADMPASMHMDMASHVHPGGRSAHSLCPYSAGPALVSLPPIHQAPSIVPVSVQLPMARAQVAHFEPAARTQTPRAPPTNA